LNPSITKVVVFVGECIEWRVVASITKVVIFVGRLHWNNDTHHLGNALTAFFVANVSFLATAP
jgi:hypothetical protein